MSKILTNSHRVLAAAALLVPRRSAFTIRKRGQAPSANPKQRKKPERDGASSHFRTTGLQFEYLTVFAVSLPST